MDKAKNHENVTRVTKTKRIYLVFSILKPKYFFQQIYFQNL